MRGGTEMGHDKTVRGGDEDPILRPRPAPLSSLVKTLTKVAHDIHVNSKKKKKNTVPIFIYLFFWDKKIEQSQKFERDRKKKDEQGERERGSRTKATAAWRVGA